MASEEALPPHATVQSEEEQKGLDDLRKLLSARDTADVLPQAMVHAAPFEQETELLLRFLRARNCKATDALKMIQDDLEWRENKNVLRYRTCTASSVIGGCDVSLLEEIFDHGFLGYDKFNRPVVYKGYGGPFLVNKVVPKHMTLEELVNYDNWLCEKLIQRLPKEAQSFVVIIDLKGLGFANVRPNQFSYSRGLNDAGAPHYPERLGHMYIVNSPWIFRGAYATISSWLDKRTKEKVQLLGGEDAFLPELEKIMDIDILPEIIGGKAKLGGCKSIAGEMGDKAVEEKGGAAAQGEEINVDQVVTPLFKAFQDRNYEEAKLLIEGKADVNARDEANTSPLMWASRCGKVSLVQMLLDEKADPNTTDQKGESALMMASNSSLGEVVEVLLDGGATIDLAVHLPNDNQDGWTALTYAVVAGNSSVVKLLLERKADPNLADQDGCTPLMQAAANGEESSVTLLLEMKADPTQTSKEGFTALSLAQDGQMQQVIALLEATV